MAVGVLLLTHEAIGPALVAAARQVLGRLPLEVRCIEVGAGADPDERLEVAVQAARSLDRGDGILALTDLFGGTPCNVARRLDASGLPLVCVPGLNLPMLLRVLNYPEQGLAELADTAASGGRRGIFVDKKKPA